MFCTNPLLQKHSVQYELCFNKYFLNGSFLMVWHERFLHTSRWVSEEGQEFENFSKNAVFLISSGEKQISLLLASRRKTLKFTSGHPLEKFLSTPMHTSM